MLAFVPRYAVAQQPAPKVDSDETLLLEVQINGHTTGKIGEFILRGGKLMVKPDELRDLGVRVPNTLALQPGGYIALSDLSGVTSKLDQVNQVLQITIAENRLVPQVVLPNGKQLDNRPRVVESGIGLTVNYDMVGTFTNGANSGAGSNRCAFVLADRNPEFGLDCIRRCRLRQHVQLCDPPGFCLHLRRCKYALHVQVGRLHYQRSCLDAPGTHGRRTTSSGLPHTVRIS